MAKGMVEGEIRQCIAEGGKIRGVYIVASGPPDQSEYVAYLRPSWKRGFHPLSLWGGKADRTYKDLDRLLLLVRDTFGWCGVVPVFARGDTDAPRYRDLAANSPSFEALLERLECDGAPPRPDD